MLLFTILAPEPVCPAANNDPDHCALVDPRYDCETDEQCDAGETCCEGDCTGRYCKAMGEYKCT